MQEHTELIGLFRIIVSFSSERIFPFDSIHGIALMRSTSLTLRYCLSPAEQRWAYISHQMPNEALLLRCYDSEMGSQGQALFSAHTAVDVINEPLPAGVEEGTPLIPRTSVEVRLIVLHK